MGGLWTTALRVSGERLANIHQEQLKSHSGILPRVTAPSRSVGRLSAGHHRLILPLCELRQRTASTPLTPPQRHYNSKDKINILQREPLGTIHTVVTFVEIPPLQTKQCFDFDSITKPQVLQHLGLFRFIAHKSAFLLL